MSHVVTTSSSSYVSLIIVVVIVIIFDVDCCDLYIKSVVKSECHVIPPCDTHAGFRDLPLPRDACIDSMSGGASHSSQIFDLRVSPDDLAYNLQFHRKSAFLRHVV